MENSKLEIEDPIFAVSCNTQKQFVSRLDKYIGTILLPILRKGDIVVMNNLSAHLDGRVKPLIESKDASVWYLPATLCARQLGGKLVESHP